MKEFDFVIEQKVVLQSIEEYGTHILSMELVKGNIEDVMTELLSKCKGHSFNESYSAMMKVFVESYFAKAYENTKKMKSLLEDAIPRINNSLVRCSEFYLQLCNDSYIEPNTPASGDNQIRNGGILAINYNKISSLVDTCTDIKENGEKIRNEIQDLINSVSGDVPEVDVCDSELATAYKYFKRIENLRVSFILYKVECVALEGILQEGLASMNSCTQAMTPYDDIKDSDWMPEDEVTAEVLAIDYSHLEKFLNEEQLDELRKAVHNENDFKLLEKIASGNYKEAFLVSPSSLSDEMKVALTVFGIELSGLCDYELEDDELSGVAKAAREEMKTMVEKLVEQGNGGQAQEYLELFVQGTSMYATATSACVAVNGNYNGDIEEQMNAIKDAMNTWLTVSAGINSVNEACGEYAFATEPVLEIGQFGYGYGPEGEVSFRCEIVQFPASDAGPDEVQKFVAESKYYAGCSFPVASINADLVAKEEELEVAYRDIIIGAAIDKIPGDYNGMIQAVYDGSVKDFAKEVAGEIPILKEVYGPVVDAIERISGLKKEISELEEDKRNLFFMQAIETNVYSIYGEEVGRELFNKPLLSTNYSFLVLDPAIAENTMKWSNYGLLSVFEDDNATPVELLEKAKEYEVKNKDFLDALSDNEDLRNAVLYMIYGNSIYSTGDDGKTIAESVGYTGNFKTIYDIPASDLADATDQMNSGYIVDKYFSGEQTKANYTIYQLWGSETGLEKKAE